MRNSVWVTATLAMALALAAPAHAERRGGRDDRSAATFQVSRESAEATARAEGMVEIWETKARRGVWKFEGAMADGRKLEVSIHGQSGVVVKREVYNADGSRSRRSSSS
jgi:hypothetical protein